MSSDIRKNIYRLLEKTVLMLLCLIVAFTATSMVYANDNNGREAVNVIHRTIKTVKQNKKVKLTKFIYKDLPEKKLPLYAESYRGLSLIKVSWSEKNKFFRRKLKSSYTIRGREAEPDFPEYREIRGNIDGEEVLVRGKLKNIKLNEYKYMKPFNATLIFYGNQSNVKNDGQKEYYEYKGLRLPAGNLEDYYKIYEEDILKAIKKDPSLYKLNKAEWIGGAKASVEGDKPIMIAKFSGVKEGKSWTAFYEEDIDDEALKYKVYKATCYYGKK